jgi:hypothetical protein
VIARDLPASGRANPAAPSNPGTLANPAALANPGALANQGVTARPGTPANPAALSQPGTPPFRNGVASGAAFGYSPDAVARGHATRNGVAHGHAAGRAAANANGHAASGRGLNGHGATAYPVARAAHADLPFARAHPEGRPAPKGDGRANCGPLEKVLWRQWEEGTVPHPQAVAAVERLASFPRGLQEKLAEGLTGIFVGNGGVPELDHMSELRGVPLPSGRATWDACAGAYGEHKIVVGTRPSPTPDVVCHEVGHALDDLDSPPGKWQSDSPEFRLIYDQCRPHLASDFHRQRGGLGQKEFFADSFAAIASGQRPALVDMLGGNTRAALRVMLYFNRRYGI